MLRPTLLGITLWSIALAIAPPALALDWAYTIRPGDSPWTLARRYCREKTCWPVVAHHNKLAAGQFPRVGQRIRFPLDVLTRRPIEARVAGMRGEVFLRRRGQTEAPLQATDLLRIDDRIRTGNGSVTVRFADTSELLVGPESTIVFDMLGAFGDGGMVDTQVRALRGRVEPRVRSGTSFRIVTPTGTAVVRGTDFRVRAEDASFVELTEGALDFSGTTLPTGFGIVAAATVAPPEELLPAPRFESASDDARGSPFAFAWQPVAGATHYQVFALTARTPTSPPSVVRLFDAAEPRAEVALPEGDYNVVVRAVAPSGLEGLNGELAVRIAEPLGTLTLEPDGRLSWPAFPGAVGYQVMKSAEADFANVLATLRVDDTWLPGPLPAKRQWIRARALDASGAPMSIWSTAIAVQHQLPVIALTAKARSWRSERVRLVWSEVAGASYRLQIGSTPEFAGDVREVTTLLRSFSVECPFAACYARVRAEQGADSLSETLGPQEPTDTADRATRGDWSAPVKLDAASAWGWLRPRG